MTTGQGGDPSPLPTAVESAALAAVAALPLVGPMLADLIGSYRTQLQISRLTLLVEELSATLTAIAESRVDQSYARSHEFAEYILHVAEIAASSHRREKIRLLARVAAGAATPDPDDFWRHKFLDAMATIEPEHVSMLRQVADRAAEDASPLDGNDIGQTLLNDLVAIGLVDRQQVMSGTGTEVIGRFSSVNVAATGPPRYTITAGGSKFLAFIAAADGVEPTP